MAVVRAEPWQPQAQTCGHCGRQHLVATVTAIPPEFGPGWLCAWCRHWNEIR